MTLNRRTKLVQEMYRQKAGNQQFQNFGNLVNQAIGEPTVGSISKAGLSGVKGIAQRAMADARRVVTGTSLKDRAIAQGFRDTGRNPANVVDAVSPPQVRTSLPENRDTLEISKPLPRVDQIQEQTPGIPTPEKLTNNRKKQLEEYISPGGSEEAWNDFYDDSKKQAQWEILTNQDEPRNQPKPKKKSSNKKIVPSNTEKTKTKDLKEITDTTIKKVEETKTKTTSSGTAFAKGFDDQILAGLLGVGIGVGTNQLLQPAPEPKNTNSRYDRYYG